jgi:hypothetical protein
VDQDQEQLRLLSIFHYVVGGLLGLFACLPFLHVILGIAVVTGALPEKPNESEFPPILGWVFIVVGSLVILTGWTLAAAVVVAGRSLARHRYYTFCLIVAAIECLFVPFGTVLGVFTIVVLVRPSVRQLFEQPGGPPA